MVELAIRRAPVVAHSEWLKVLPPATRFAFYGGADAQAAAYTAWGVEFPAGPCRANTRSRRATLWLGPDEYLLLDSTDVNDAASSAGNTVAALAAGLESAVGDLSHALVDVSHRQFAIEVSGPYAATILSGACPLDLDLGEFPVGMCTRTVFAKADIVLWRIAVDSFHVEVWRSFRGYVTGVLQEIAAEFYPKP